jgi:hypothetical protein
METNITASSIVEPQCKQLGKKYWSVILEEDDDTGDLILPLTEEMLEDLGWELGDTVEWNINDDATSITIKNKTKQLPP